MADIEPGTSFLSWRAVSSKPQMETESLEVQHAKNMEIVTRYRGILVAELEVPGVSRSIDSFEEARRLIPAYQRLWEIINNKSHSELMILVARDRSRLGRTVSLVEGVIRACNTAGIAIYPRNMPPMTLDPRRQQEQANLLYGLIGSLQAQAEIETLVSRHAEGMLGRVRSGKHPSKLPFWLERVHDRHGNESYEVVDAMKTVVMRWIELFMADMPVREIADTLNREGYRHPGGREWLWGDLASWHELAWRMAGYIEYNRESKHDSPYLKVNSPMLPAIVDEDMAQRIIEKAKERATFRQLRQRRRYSGCITCGYCGGRMVVQNRSPVAYQCRNRCTGAYIQEKWLDAALHEAIDYIAKEVNRDELIAAISEPSDDLQRRIAAVTKDVADLDGQKERLLYAYMQGNVEYDLYERQNNALKDRAKSLQDKLLALQEEDRERQGRLDARWHLDEVASIGHQMLADDMDIALTGEWIKAHFEIVVLENRVDTVRYK